MSDLSDEIADQALLPQTVSTDGTTTTNHSLPDLIAADTHLRNASATSPTNIVSALRGMAVKLVPPGAH